MRHVACRKACVTSSLFRTSVRNDEYHNVNGMARVLAQQGTSIRRMRALVTFRFGEDCTNKLQYDTSIGYVLVIVDAYRAENRDIQQGQRVRLRNLKNCRAFINARVDAACSPAPVYISITHKYTHNTHTQHTHTYTHIYIV